MGDFLVFERFVWFDAQVRQKRFPNAVKLAELVKSGAEYAEPKIAIRDPYIFEFLGLKPKEVMGESAIEDRLLDKLQEFLLELGHGLIVA